ncbi:MAG: nuclear transport factor 2 family protein [Dermatophilaceae bacterium]
MTKPDDLAERVYVLEAKDDIRRLMAAYVHARDITHGPVADYFTADAVWEGIGRLADVLGRHEGRSAIVARFAGPVPPSLHLLANESITVDGDDAVGYWTYLQPSVLAGRAFWVAARYHNDFHRQEGRWRFQHVRIEGIFEAPYEEGWAQAAFFAR